MRALAEAPPAPGRRQRDLYPVFLDLEGRPVTVVGGGVVAEEKTEALLAAGARVTVIAAELTPRLAELAAAGRLLHLAREFRSGDLAGARLVLAERRGEAGDRAVFAEAEAAGIFVNVQDRLPRCSFHAPALVRRGLLTVALSTAGAAPALAVRLRQRLEGQLGAEIGRLLELVAPLREELARRVPDFGERRGRWYRLVDSDVLDLLRSGDETAACRRIAEHLGVGATESAP